MGVQNPAAGITVLAIAEPHTLGDHLAILAGRDLIMPPIQRQTLRGTDDQPARFRRIQPNRPAEAAFKSVGEQAASAVKPDRAIGINRLSNSDWQVSQLTAGLHIE